MYEFKDITYFYKPGMIRGLKIASYNLPGDTKEENKEWSHDSDSSESDFRCFVGWKIGDVQYSEVIGIDLNKVEFSPKKDLIISECKPSIQAIISKISGSLLKVRTESIPLDLKAEVIIKWCFSRVSVSKQAMKMGLKVSQIKNIIYEFQTLRKAYKKVQKSLSNVRRKLEVHHVEWLAEFVKDYQLSGFTRSDEGACLLRSFPDLDSISLSSVGNALHRNLRLSFKKLGGTKIKKVRPESQHNLIESLKLLISWLKDQYYLIFVDQFTVNRQTQWTYGWT